MNATKGIVTTAGGPLYFLNAYLNVTLLRQNGCELPIEWFYLGAELTRAQIREIKKIPCLRLVNLGGRQKDNTKDKGGWQSKIEAICASRFDEVLFLDADSFPRRDPEYMFYDPLYIKHGALFWPDMWQWSADNNPHLGKAAGKNVLDAKFGVTLPEQQVESGQMMFAKRKCRKALEAVRTLNRNSADTYQVVFGDKDTFLIGFLQTQTDFLINPHPCTPFRGGLLQMDLQGDGLFVHLTGAKFQRHSRQLVSDRDLPGASRAAAITRDLIDRGVL